jgi:nitroreductase
MDVIEAIHQRRSIRAYRPAAVDREVLEALVWDAAQAPPPSIRTVRRWTFTVVQGVAALKDLGERAKQHARDTREPGTAAWADDPAFKVFWDAPALLLIACREGDPDAAWDCCRAGQNVLLSAHARGLGACWVGSPLPWLATPAGRAALGLAADMLAVAPIVVGYPAVTPAAPTRERPPIDWR